MPEVAAASSLMVACTLRSGSNLLCDVLHDNGFGNPSEWFRTDSLAGAGGHVVQSDAHLLDCQATRFFDAHQRAAWRAVKFDWPQFVRFANLSPKVPALRPALASLTEAHWIFLRRRDLAAQAVSLHAAQASGAWVGETGEGFDGLAYDFEALWERFGLLAVQEYCWTAYFREAGVTPITLVYEDMVGWPETAWLDLFRKLSPGFDAARLDLAALGRRPRSVPRLTEIKQIFRAELRDGRQPRSLAGLFEEIGALVGRAQRLAAPDGTPSHFSDDVILGRFAEDLLSRPGGFRLHKLDLRVDLQCEGGFACVEQEHFLDRMALRLDADGSCGFEASGRRILIQFHAHGWSGIAEIRIGDVVETLDLFDERAGTRHYLRELPAGFSGRVSVRPAGGRHALSAGWEVWIQRVMLLQPDASGSVA